MERFRAISAGFELGQEGFFAPRRKQWIITAAATAVGLASSLIGSASASKAAREAAARQRRQEAAEDAWYNRRYNEHYADTEAGQNLLRRAREFRDENVKRANGAQAVAGGTEAATAMAKEAGNKMVGDTIANIAATDQAKKASVDAQHLQNQRRFAEMDMNREQQRAQNITEAAQNASNAIMQGTSAFEPSLTGGNNGGKETDDDLMLV